MTTSERIEKLEKELAELKAEVSEPWIEVDGIQAGIAALRGEDAEFGQEDGSWDPLYGSWSIDVLKASTDRFRIRKPKGVWSVEGRVECQVLRLYNEGAGIWFDAFGNTGDKALGPIDLPDGTPVRISVESIEGKIGG